MCENPAKVYGLFPRKGHIEVGADADLVILDMEKVETIRNENIVSKCGWSAFEGKTFKGAADTVLLRGTVIAEGGVFKGEVGYGKFTAREESCLK
jgi:dihydroorotase-like cyclic amidohydrolase